MNNLSDSETAVIASYLATLYVLEPAVPAASDNLDSESAANWKHNPNEIGDRLRLLDEWRRRLCAFLGVPCGPGLGNVGLALIV
jgi:hypothetical protein